MKKYVVELDGLRGIAILGVLLCHFSQIYARSSQPFLSGLSAALGYGGFGVDLFFVLSGFLISGILLDARMRPHYFRNFWFRRVLRIFPLYYGYLALVFLVIYPICSRLELSWAPSSPASYPKLWPYLAYLQNWTTSRGLQQFLLSHLWSLAIEEQFYLVWPAVVYWFPRRFLGWLCVAIAIGAVALRVALSLNGADGETIKRITPARLDTLMIGTLIAWGMRDANWKGRLEKSTPALFWIGMLASIAILAICDELITRTAGWFVLALFFGTCVILALNPGSRMALILRNPMLRSFGVYSYGIYVLHSIFNELGPALLGFSWSTWQFRFILICYIPAMIIGSYGLAWLSYHGIESRFLALKRYFAD